MLSDELMTARPSVEEIKKVRSLLLQDEKIATFVRVSGSQVENRDLLLSCICLIGGLCGQIFIAQELLILAPVFSIIQIIGMTGFSSLSHESWHRRINSWQAIENFLARFVVNPIFLRQFNETLNAHWNHHRFMGSDQDPDSLVWKQNKIEYRNNQLKRLLVIPAALSMAKGILTNKRSNRRQIPQAKKAPKDVKGILISLSLHAVWVGLLAMHSLWLLLFGYFVPFVVGAILANIREYAEHSYGPDGRLIVFDTLCSDWERLLIGGGYFNLHALHHVFPEVPQRKLPLLYQMIEKRPELIQSYYGSTPVIQKKFSYFKGELAQ